MLDFSPVQIILVLAIALLVLGPKRLPGMAKSLGHGLRGFATPWRVTTIRSNTPMRPSLSSRPIAVGTTGHR